MFSILATSISAGVYEHTLLQPALNGDKLSCEGIFNVAEISEPIIQRRVKVRKNAYVGYPELKATEFVEQAILII